MRKLLIVFIIGLSLLSVGCGESSEKLTNNEYVAKLTTTIKDTIESVYLKAEDLKENSDLEDKEKFNEFIKSITKFKTDDESINMLNDKMIEVSKEVYNMLDERINLKKYSEEYNKLTKQISEKKDEIATIIIELYNKLGIKINS